MAVGDAYVFPGFLTPVLTLIFFPKPPTTFPTCFCRGERRKYAGKKSRLNGGSKSQPPGHEPDTLTTDPPGGARERRKEKGKEKGREKKEKGKERERTKRREGEGKRTGKRKGERRKRKGKREREKKEKRERRKENFN